MDRYDVCDVYKNEKIPDKEVRALFMFHVEHLPLPVLPYSRLAVEAWVVERPRWVLFLCFIVDLSQISGHYWLLHIKFNLYAPIMGSFAYFGFQSLVENMIVTNQRFMNRQTERQMISSIDSWHDLTEVQIHDMELKCMEELKEMIKSAELSQA